MLGMTRFEAYAYDLRLRFTKKIKQVTKVEPLYLDDNCYEMDEMVYRVAGLNPFVSLSRAMREGVI